MDALYLLVSFVELLFLDLQSYIQNLGTFVNPLFDSSPAITPS